MAIAEGAVRLEVGCGDCWKVGRGVMVGAIETGGALVGANDRPCGGQVEGLAEFSVGNDGAVVTTTGLKVGCGVMVGRGEMEGLLEGASDGLVEGLGDDDGAANAVGAIDGNEQSR